MIHIYPGLVATPRQLIMHHYQCDHCEYQAAAGLLMVTCLVICFITVHLPVINGLINSHIFHL